MLERIRAIADSFRKVKDPSMSLVRFACYEDLEKKITLLDNPDIKVIEFGGSNGVIRSFFNKADYEVALNYPDVDVQDLSSFKNESYDIVVLDQILEHVEDPVKAISEIHRILKEGGVLIGATPFLIFVHPVPSDFWRFTEDGLMILLKSFSEVEIKSWGNRITLELINRHGFTVSVGKARKILKFRRNNEPAFPLTYWFTAIK